MIQAINKKIFVKKGNDEIESYKISNIPWNRRLKI